MSRLVRCPKCSKLLVENSAVPLYQCGGCGTVLRAKNYNPSGDNAIKVAPQISSDKGNQSENRISENGSTPTRNHETSGDDAMTEPPDISCGQKNHTETDISGIGSTSANEIILPSSSSPSPKVNNEEERQMAPDDNPACSCVDGKQHNENGEPFQTDSETVESSSMVDSSKANGESSMESKHHATATVEAERESTDGQLDKLLKSNDQGPDISKMTNEVGQSPNSLSNIMASPEELADTLQNSGRDNVLKSPDAIFSSHAYEGSISGDGGQTTHSPNWQQHLPKEMEQENPRERNKMSSHNQSDHQMRGRLSTSSNERHSIDAVRGKVSLHHENGEQERMKYFDSNESQSVHNWTPEKAGGSSGDTHSHLELLRKLDELRVRITELCEKRPPPGGIHEIRQSFDPRLNPSLNHQLRRPSYEQSPQHYHNMQEMSLPGQQQKFANHHKRGPYGINVNDMHSHSSKEHGIEKSYTNSRLKHRCRPASGAAPFVICYNCAKLLQLPADFLVMRKKLHKLQCASCNEVLMFSFPDRTSSNPETPSRSVHSPTEVDKVKNGLNYRTNGNRQGYPLSSFDDHGTPFAKNYSREPPLHVSRKAPERSHLKGKGPLRLHRLMGYGSASELLYQHGESDDGSENSEMLAHHSRRSSNEIHASNKSRGSGTSTPQHQEQIRNTSSLDSLAIHEEGGSHGSSKTQEMGLPHPGMLADTGS